MKPKPMIGMVYDNEHYAENGHCACWGIRKMAKFEVFLIESLIFKEGIQKMILKLNCFTILEFVGPREGIHDSGWEHRSLGRFYDHTVK
jgi:hypothetical protein